MSSWKYEKCQVSTSKINGIKERVETSYVYIWLGSRRRRGECILCATVQDVHCVASWIATDHRKRTD